jgi:hypothetical protein
MLVCVYVWISLFLPAYRYACVCRLQPIHRLQQVLTFGQWRRHLALCFLFSLPIAPLLTTNSEHVEQNKNRTAARIFTTTPSQGWQLRVCVCVWNKARSVAVVDGAMPPPAQPQPSHARARARAPFPAVAGRGRVGRPRAWDACEGTWIIATTSTTAAGVG